jgi:hypothetical protein
MEQKTVYELHMDHGLGFRSIYAFTTIEAAEKFAQNSKSREEQHFKIVCVTTTYTHLKPFTVAAYIPTVEEIADDIIGYADGAFSIDWGEDFEKLSDADQRKVEDMVNQEISNCDHCGWHFSNQNMETGVLSGDWLCYSCAGTEEDEANEDEEEQ